MKITRPYHRENFFNKWWHNLDFLQRRLMRTCFSMLVMILCFPLYYLGFFGSIDGPLHPRRIGDALSGMGVTQTHCMVLFLSFLIIAVSWNWIYNWVSLRMGARLTCKRTIGDDRTVCGATVKRKMIVHKRTGRPVTQYVCANGHKRPDAHFHPVKKGTFSHTLWVLSLCFCIIVFFMS